MITESDNDAASDLWDDVGRYDLQHFLNLAHMTQTYPGPGPYWGLTQITAYNEVLLLRLLLNRNSVLDTSSRDYVLAYGPGHAPRSAGVSRRARPDRLRPRQNGWLPPDPHGWSHPSRGRPRRGTSGPRRRFRNHPVRLRPASRTRSDSRVARYIEQASPNAVTSVLFGVAGLTFLLKAGGGLYWMIPAVLASLVGGVINAWLFLLKVPA